MWSLFSRDPLKDFGYEIEDEILYTTRSFWELHNGAKKSTGEPVSIFICDLKHEGENKLSIAKATVKRLKTLRHPNILKYVDSLEGEKLVYLVTERIEPLDGYFKSKTEYTNEHKTFAISFGLYQISKGLWFLINDCNLNHNNVCLESVFVSRSGEWQLGGMEFVSLSTESPPKKPKSFESYIVQQDTSSKQKWSNDSWGLGCLVWEIFNGILPKSSSLQDMDKIPKAIAPHYSNLLCSNASKRMSPGEFVEKCRTTSGYMKNSFVDTMIFLEEIQVKEGNETSPFFSGLSNLLDSFPVNTCKYKVLPQLLNAFEFGNAGSSILNPIFKISKLLDEDEYQKKIVPCVVKLFSSKDRSTRAKLLQQMDHFIHHLQPALVNEQIFPQISQGFLDTNPTIREQTIKAMLHVASKLNYQNLNDEVMKHFARLQVKDDQGGIRTNTTVCLGKIACHLHPQVRQKVLITAFARAMRDPFSPARIAGIVALSSTQSFYTVQDCAKKILPVLCQLTVDPDKSVRDQAFRAVKGFLGKLEKVSEDPTLIEEIESDVNSASTSNVSSSIASSLAGWAVTSFTSKFYKTTSKAKSSTTIADGESIAVLETTKNKSSKNLPEQEEKTTSAEKSIIETNNQWNDSDWTGDTLESPDSNQESQNINDGWGQDEAWEDFDVKIQAESKAMKSANETSLSASSYKIEDTSTSIEGGEWNDWDSPFESGDKDSKKKREEKKLQRQNELQDRRAARQAAKGPLKLGARKM